MLSSSGTLFGNTYTKDGQSRSQSHNTIVIGSSFLLSSSLKLSLRCSGSQSGPPHSISPVLFVAVVHLVRIDPVRLGVVRDEQSYSHFAVTLYRTMRMQRLIQVATKATSGLLLACKTYSHSRQYVSQQHNECHLKGSIECLSSLVEERRVRMMCALVSRVCLDWIASERIGLDWIGLEYCILSNETSEEQYSNTESRRAWSLLNSLRCR